MATFVEHVHCLRCGKRCSGVDPELGLVVRAWVECPECLEKSEGNSAKSEGTSPRLFSELDRSSIDAHRAAIFVAEFFVWWEQAGRHYYGTAVSGADEGLQIFARESVEALGGWRAARRTLRSQGQPVERGTSPPSPPPFPIGGDA
jgi:hypothetical protein